jgi:hypothetical protein
MNGEILFPWTMRRSFSIPNILNIILGIMVVALGVVSIGFCLIGRLRGIYFGIALFFIAYGVLIFWDFKKEVVCTNEGIKFISVPFGFPLWIVPKTFPIIFWKNIMEVTAGRYVIFSTRIFICQEGENWMFGLPGYLNGITCPFYSKADLAILVDLLEKNAPQAVLDKKVKSFKNKN